MDIFMIMQIVLELLTECRKNRSRSEVLGRMKRIGRLERIIIRRKMRRDGYSRREISHALSEIAAHNLTDEDFEELQNEVEDRAAAHGIPLQ